LEKPVGDDEESEFGHFLTDETAPLPEESAEQALRRDTLKQILCSLSPREQRSSRCATGSTASSRGRSDEVGRAFNVTRERIRQIENQCLKKLRALADCQKLREVA
jgi:RNA polymerase primary sigma factor